MIIYSLGALALILLFILYKKTRSRKAFYGFTLTIALAGAIAYFAWPATRSSQEVMSQQQRYALVQEQQVFAAWYEEYQKDLNELDRNWQWYHHILESFKEDNISLQTLHVRLKQLELDSNQVKERMAGRKPPLELSDYTYDQTAQLLEKTNDYVNAQCRAISLTRAASDPALMPAADQQEQSQLLQMVMIKESPVKLFIADEVSAIRQQLELPKESFPLPEESVKGMQ
jgi:hypothetical protein